MARRDTKEDGEDEKARSDLAALEFWRRQLPGVPDDQIELPRNQAKHLVGFAPANGDETSVANTIRRKMIYSLVFLPAMPLDRRAEYAPTMRRLVRNISARAFRWWDRLGEPTLLSLNQAFYSHRNGWRDVVDVGEMGVCYALCIAWCDLPPEMRSSAEAKRSVARLLQSLMRQWLEGRDQIT